MTDTERERQYWFLMRRLLLDVRMEVCFAYAVAWWDPRHWRECWRRMRRVCDLVNAFHNLPAFGSWGWERFDEARFWEDIAAYSAKHPEDRRANYREVFESRLAGDERVY